MPRVYTKVLEEKKVFILYLLSVLT
jgi:hypothetical protein